MRRASLATSVGLGALLAACAGGGSGTGEEPSSWDPVSGSVEPGVGGREPAAGSVDGAPRTGDPAAGGLEAAPGAQQGGGTSGLDCSGTYECREEGEKDTDTITLVSTAGGCSVPGGKSTTIVLAPDGSLLINGKKVGAWSSSANGLTVSTEDGTTTCTKR